MLLSGDLPTSGLHLAYLIYQILLEAGLPKDVIYSLPGDAKQIINPVLERLKFAAISFIGSVQVFKGIQKKIGDAVGKNTYNL